MFFRRTPPEPVIDPQPAQLDSSLRRQGAIEALNLIAHSLADAAQAARAEVSSPTADNFLAGQFMAFGQVLSCIERERDLLQQQLMQEAGLHSASAEAAWDAEMILLNQLPLGSEELFRLAMDFRRVDIEASDQEVETTEPEAVNSQGNASAGEAPPEIAPAPDTDLSGREPVIVL